MTTMWETPVFAFNDVPVALSVHNTKHSFIVKYTRRVTKKIEHMYKYSRVPLKRKRLYE